MEDVDCDCLDLESDAVERWVEDNAIATIRSKE